MAKCEFTASLVKFGFDFLECGALPGKISAHVWEDEDLVALVSKLSSFPRNGRHLFPLFVAQKADDHGSGPLTCIRLWSQRAVRPVKLR